MKNYSTLLCLFIFIGINAIGQKQYHVNRIKLDTLIKASGILFYVDTMQSLEERNRNELICKTLIDGLKFEGIKGKITFYGEDIDTSDYVIFNTYRRKTHNSAIRVFGLGILPVFTPCYVIEFEQANKVAMGGDLLWIRLKIRVDKFSKALEQVQKALPKKIKKHIILSES